MKSNMKSKDELKGELATFDWVIQACYKLGMVAKKELEIAATENQRVYYLAALDTCTMLVEAFKKEGDGIVNEIVERVMGEEESNKPKGLN